MTRAVALGLLPIAFQQHASGIAPDDPCPFPSADKRSPSKGSRHGTSAGRWTAAEYAPGHLPCGEDETPVWPAIREGAPHNLPSRCCDPHESKRRKANKPYGRTTRGS